eukprot:6192139-Pleurochrysis_carterae.AAC.1
MHHGRRLRTTHAGGRRSARGSARGTDGDKCARGVHTTGAVHAEAHAGADGEVASGARTR